MRAQTRIFAMITNEAQANPDSVTCIKVVFGSLVRALSIFRSNGSFVSFAFVLYVDRELSKLKRKLMVMTLLREQIS